MAEPTQGERVNLETHVELCAERYDGIRKRLSRMEAVLCAIVLLLLFGQGTVTDVAKRLLLPAAATEAHR